MKKNKKLILVESEMKGPKGHFLNNLIETTFNFNKKFNIMWILNKDFTNSGTYLPKKIKDAVLEKLSKYKSKNNIWTSTFNDMEKWMETEPSDYKEKQNSFIEFNTKIDNIRKEKFNDVFPEYSRLFA